MGSALHVSARTTPRIRAELQASQESSRALAARYDLNPKTVRKRRNRTTTADAPMGPKAPKSTVLTPAEKAMVMAFREKTMLPLDDVLGCLRDTIPNLSRSALRRCLQRHSISRLPVDETKEQCKRFKTYKPARAGGRRPSLTVVLDCGILSAPAPFGSPLTIAQIEEAIVPARNPVGRQKLELPSADPIVFGLALGRAAIIKMGSNLVMPRTMLARGGHQ